MKKKYYLENEINLLEIKERLKKGEVLIYPTDTVYGLGATFYSEEGVKRIYKIKNRNIYSPLIALISKKDEYEKIASIPEGQKDIFEKLSTNFWPGSLTIVLNKKESVPLVATLNKKTIGVRLPNMKLTRKIIENCGGIVFTTSANISGEKTPTSYKELSKNIKERADIIIGTEELLLGIESTIIDITGDTPKLLREGAIKKESIEKIIGLKIE